MNRKLSLRLLAGALSVLLLLTLAACGGKAPSGSGSSTASVGSTAGTPGTDGKTYTVGICQLTPHEALDAATKGFRDTLTEEFGDKVTFDDTIRQMIELAE
jgi:putative ABC transport system substrate-binding protein